MVFQNHIGNLGKVEETNFFFKGIDQNRQITFFPSLEIWFYFALIQLSMDFGGKDIIWVGNNMTLTIT